ncbi:MAG: LTA synthase family protein, partial [Erysipelotrichia bacterium]|nr:LTA synthase family protein [Erysipelotrichia bacterium]
LKALLLSIILFTIAFYSNQLSMIAYLSLILCIIYGANKVGIFTYILNLFRTTSLYEDYYVDSKEVSIHFPNKKRNLIYLYIESLETTYTSKENGGAYDDDLIKELTTLAKENINFSHQERLGGAFIVAGTGWTTGGIVAQSSGIPLLVPINCKRFNEQTPFFPNLYALGDILKKEGYNQEYLIGSDAVFGGRKYYYDKHGAFKIFDLNTAYKEHKLDSDYKVFWGYEDEKLFQFAKEEITNLAKQDKPFHFSLLSVDTHHPYGYVDKNYQDEYPERLSNIIRGNSKKIGAFIDWLKKQPFYDNTTIIISGDHTSMAAQYIHKTYDKHYERTIFNTFINANKQTSNTKNRTFTSFDMFPTTLSALGATIKGDRLGLGTNLFSSQKTLAEKISLATLDKELKKQSKYYKQKIMK